ncbi:MAG: TldD/PmbA family protein [Candidatus Hodarchaeales archaeon]|jgi:PmbA protein
MISNINVPSSSWKFANQVELFFEEKSTLLATVEASKLKSIKSVETHGGAARVYKDNKPGWSYSSFIGNPEKLVKQAVSMTLQSSPFKLDVNFPEKKGVIGETSDYSDNWIKRAGFDEINEITGLILETVNQYNNLSCRARVSISKRKIRVVNSNGIDVTTTLTSFKAFIGLNYHDPINEMTGGMIWCPLQSRFYDSNSLTSMVGKFSDLAIANINPIKTRSDIKSNLIYSPLCVSLFLRAGFIPAINAKNVYLGKSPLADKIGEKLTTVEITNETSDHVSGTSVPFDSEGNLAKPITIIDKEGIFKSFLCDTLYAKLLGLNATSSLQRESYDSNPSIGINTLDLKPRTSNLTLKEMIEDTKQGIIAFGFSGNVNPANGNFSGLLKGAFTIENGDQVSPLTDVNIQGNVYELLKQDFTRDDISCYRGVKSPFVRTKAI